MLDEDVTYWLYEMIEEKLRDRVKAPEDDKEPHTLSQAHETFPNHMFTFYGFEDSDFEQMAEDYVDAVEEAYVLPPETCPHCSRGCDICLMLPSRY